MEEYSEEYLTRIKDKLAGYELLAKYIDDGISDRIEIENFTGMIIIMPIEKMYKKGYLPMSRDKVFIIKENDEYWAYNYDPSANLIVKGYVSVETYNYMFEEHGEALKIIAERTEKRHREAVMRRQQRSLYSGGLHIPRHTFSLMPPIGVKESKKPIEKKKSLRTKLKWPYKKRK